VLAPIITYGKFGNLFCGVEHTICNGQEKLHALTLKKKKGEFLIENYFECDIVAKLNKQLQKNQHLFLIINTKKVLSKVLNGIYDDQKAITLTFPNLKINDFYYEILQTDTHTFIAICRKDYVDDIIENYNANHLNIIGFSLGSLSVSQLTNFIEADAILQTSNSTISLNNSEITSITTLAKSEDINYTINGLEITNKSVLSLAGIIAYFTSSSITSSNFNAITDNLYSHFKQKRIFDVGLKFSLITVFLSLLISFLLYSSYATKIDVIFNQLELNKTYKTSLLKLSDQVNKKERLVTDFSLASSKASWYVDQIGKALPHSIILSEIQFQPLEKSIKKEQEVLIHKNLIFIKGKSNNSTDYSNWIYTLEQQHWIEKVIIQEYGIGKKTATEFKLQIEISK